MSKTQLWLWEGVFVPIVDHPDDPCQMDDESKARVNAEACRDIRRQRFIGSMKRSVIGSATPALLMHERINDRLPMEFHRRSVAGKVRPESKPRFGVGDYARCLESGWLGKILDVDAEGMARMVGVDWMANVVAGMPREESLSHDDIQWFALVDLLPA